MSSEENSANTQKPILRILSLDGGGARGFYTIGILEEVETIAKKPLYMCFDLIFGTSTGAIIAALLARGDSISEIRKLYEAHVPKIMRRKTRRGRSAALRKLADDVFGNAKFDVFRTNVGI